MRRRRTWASLACIACAAPWLGGCSQADSAYQPQVDGDAERGRIALRDHECTACHVIPGVRATPSHVGPSLEAYALRVYVAGKFPNTGRYLVPWILDAPAMAPKTAMPAYDIPEQTARDMAAYLYSLH